MSYNLENPEDLYEFSQACEEACCYCPQYHPWNPIDFGEGRNEVSPLEVLMWWRHGVGGRILFELNYYADLDEKAKNTFRQYIIILEPEGPENHIMNLQTHELLSNEPIQILTFC